MRWKKVLCITVAVCLVIAAGIYAQDAWAHYNEYKNTTKIRLNTASIYDSLFKEQLQRMTEDGISCVLWKEQRNVLVENTDFARTVQVGAMGIAGNSSCLFPGGNVLTLEDTGYCQRAKSLFDG